MICIETVLKNSDGIQTHQTIGKIKDNIISFSEKDKTEVKINLIQAIFERENKDMYLKIDFKKQEFYIYIKELDNKIILDISEQKILIKENSFKMSYILNKIEEVNYTLIWKEGSL